LENNRISKCGKFEFLGMSISPQAEGVPQRHEIRGPGNTTAQRHETAHQRHEITGIKDYMKFSCMLFFI
jgi:hypothetical protein